MYRGFIKDNQNLSGQSLGSPELRILSMTINRDILSKATSEFEVINVPDAAAEGNVFGVYDDYGKTVYLGVIASINGNVIQTDQIISLFDDNWLWSNPALATIEQTVAQIIQNDWATNIDSMLQNIFSQFTITAGTTAVNLSLPTQDDNYVTNFMEFIFQLYEAYGILLDIDIAYNNVTPTITVFQPSYTKILLGNNTNAVRNFNITTETFETNKLVVYSKDGSEYRGSWYGTTSGITTNSAAGNRLPKINTKYVFSDDPTDDIVGEYLTDNMYNHKINVELVLKNKLYNFDDFKLGQEFDIFYNDTYYNSILTGYKITVDNDGKADIVTLVFGKVRYSLENKLYKLKQQSNSSSSSSGGGGGGGTGGDFKFIKGTPIDLYDTDGTTVLYSRNPENLVFYDGDSGDEASSNFMFAQPTSAVSMPSASTNYYPNLTAVQSRGTGFEIASNGDVKCNKNGKVKVTALLTFDGNGTIVGLRGRLTKNRTVISGSYGNIYNTYNRTFPLQAVISVVSGDTLNFAVETGTANNGTLRVESSIICEYIEDYYITQSISESNTYSTNEIEIGRWIDGKPIYRKVLSGTTHATAGTVTSIDITSLNVDTVVNYRSVVNWNGTGYMTDGYYGSSTAYLMAYANSNTEFRIYSRYASRPYYLILEYTKSTD